MILEACVETVSQAIAAEQNGADRIELCARLDEDGLTPPLSLVQEVVGKLSIPVKVIIRPRNDFRFSVKTMNDMLESIQRFKKEGVSGFVLGLLDENLNVHLDSIRQLCDSADPIPCTFHKAIDVTPDIMSDLANLNTIPNLKSVLSSGGQNAARDGIGTLNEMHANFPQMEIIAAGAITHENLSYFLQQTSITSFHGRRIVPNIVE